MKYKLNIILGILVLITLCKNNVYSQTEKVNSQDKINESEIYFASKRINESFCEKDSSTVEYITKFLERDSIKVMVAHSIEENVETYYLSGKEKLNFFYNPKIYSGKKTRRKSDYYNVEGNCYEFNNEGIFHNSIYINKLCYMKEKKGLSLLEIYLLDGD